MKVFFVRHGSTDSWENNHTQQATDGLSSTGKAQAKAVAQRFANQPLDLIVSSSYARALETAQEINPNVVVSDLFSELRKPKEVRGQPRDEKVKVIMNQVYNAWLVDPNWHYSDEENFMDIKKRGLAALDFLQTQTVNNILVVTHANFLAALVGLMLLGDKISAETGLKLSNFFRLSNTGVSTCNWTDGKWINLTPLSRQ